MNKSTNIYDLLMDGGDIPDIAEVPREDGRKLGNHEPGDIVMLGGRQYIVLEHIEHKDGFTAVIARKIVHYMAFGRDADYANSEVRKWLNREFYKELIDAVGKENIFSHIVDLTADDGTGEGKCVFDFVSILTAPRYRKYRRFLPAYGQWWWTATRVNCDNSSYAHRACCVCSSGILSWVGSDGVVGGVRPFCFLKSSIFVD